MINKKRSKKNIQPEGLVMLKYMTVSEMILVLFVGVCYSGDMNICAVERSYQQAKNNFYIG